MGQPTYAQPNTVSDQEVLQIVLGVVSGMGPITEEDSAPVVQKAIDTLHEARTHETLFQLLADGHIEICGVDEAGDLMWRKVQP